MCLLLWRSLSNNVTAALREIKSAEKRIYEKADELGIDRDRPLLGSVQEKSRSSSLKDALSLFGNWSARTPAELTAEYFHIGTTDSFGYSVGKEIQYEGQPKSSGIDQNICTSVNQNLMKIWLRQFWPLKSESWHRAKKIREVFSVNKSTCTLFRQIVLKIVFVLAGA